MRRRSQAGYTVLEMVVVATAISILSLIYFWHKKEAFAFGKHQSALQFCKTLNKSIKTYRIYQSTDLNAENQLNWRNKEEAIIALSSPILGRNITLVDQEERKNKFLELIEWNPNEMKFYLKH